jgi:long-subunit acyl-CoA synthetase (AMP-forming)
MLNVSTDPVIEAHHGVLAARAIVNPINTRLTKGEVVYILDHSGARMILLDQEYKHLIEDYKGDAKVIISNDTGRSGDPYEEFLSSGRRFSQERGWAGLEWDNDENTSAVLNYTFVAPLFCPIG